MERSIHDQLIEWKENKFQKVLLLRGARQKGKTWSVRNLAKGFKYYLEVNFKNDRAIHQFFTGKEKTKGSHAEVVYILQREGNILPV